MAPALKQVGATLRRLFGSAPNDVHEPVADTVDAELVQRVRACESVVEESAAILAEAARETEKRNETLATVVAAHEEAAKAFDADDTDANATALVAAREKVPRARSLASKALEQQEQLSRSYDEAMKALEDARADVDRAAKLRACSTEVFHANAAPIAVRMVAALEEAAACAAELDRLRAESNAIAREVGAPELGPEHMVLDGLRELAKDGCRVVESDWRDLRETMAAPSTNTFNPSAGRSPTSLERDAIASSTWNKDADTILTVAHSLAYSVACGGLAALVGIIRRRSVKSDEELAQVHADLDLMLATRESRAVESRNAAARSQIEDERKRLEKEDRAARFDRNAEENRAREQRVTSGPHRTA